MPVINSRIAGDLWNPTDWENVRLALLNVVRSSTNNELKEILSWGDPTAASSDRMLQVLFTSGQVREIGWDTVLQKFIIGNTQGSRLAIATTADIAAIPTPPPLVFIPSYAGAVMELLTTFLTIPPKFADAHDSVASRNHRELDNVDTGNAIGHSYLRFRVPPAGLPTTFTIRHRRTGSNAFTELTIAMLDTNDGPVTLSGAAASLQSASGVWTDTVITILSGTFTPGGFVLMVMGYHAAPGEKQSSGAIFF